MTKSLDFCLDFQSHTREATMSRSRPPVKKQNAFGSRIESQTTKNHRLLNQRRLSPRPQQMHRYHVRDLWQSKCQPLPTQRYQVRSLSRSIRIQSRKLESLSQSKGQRTILPTSRSLTQPLNQPPLCSLPAIPIRQDQSRRRPPRASPFRFGVRKAS